MSESKKPSRKAGRPKKADNEKGKTMYIPNAILPYVLAILDVEKERHADNFHQQAKQ